MASGPLVPEVSERELVYSVQAQLLFGHGRD